MKFSHIIPFLFAALVSVGVLAGTVPPDCDQWTEYSDPIAAETDGWLRECGLAQQVTVSDDCVVGSYSVGCRTTRAYWCDEFGIEKEIPLETATSLEFWHKAAWSGWNFAVRIYMQPTSSEAQAGVTIKRLAFNFPSSTTWVQNNFQFEDGQWQWRVNNMWHDSGYEETLTELISIQWFFCSYMGVSIGDEMLIDGLCFQTSECAAPSPVDIVQLLHPVPNPFNPATNIRFVVNSPQKMEVAVYTVDGELVKILADRTFEEGLQEIPWNGRDEYGREISAGVYLVRLVGANVNLNKKLVLVR